MGEKPFDLSKNYISDTERRKCFKYVDKKSMNKVHHRYIDQTFLKSRAMASLGAGYPKQKWVTFCETLLCYNFKIRLYEAYETKSKYVTVCKNGKEFKVRFSNHKPIFQKEVSGDCDFFVGVNNRCVTNTEQALQAVFAYFKRFQDEKV